MLYKAWKNIVAVIFVIILYNNVFPQSSSIIIHSSSDIRFKVCLNADVNNENSDTLKFINNIKLKEVRLIIKFEKSNCSDLKQTLFIKPGNTYNYKITPKNHYENKKYYLLKKKYLLKQISSYPMSSDNDSDLVNNQDKSVIITTTYSIDQYVTHYNLPGYHGDIGCPWPLTLKEFNKKFRIISADSTDIDKLKTAKELFISACLFTDEVKTVGLLINDENLRLDFVKFAFKYTFDIGNYPNLEDIFQSEGIKMEFSNYIKNSTFK